MGDKMGERIKALVDGEWIEALVPGFEKDGIVTTELMLDQIGANSVWAGWSPRLIKHHTGDDFELKDKDEVPAVAILELERRTEGREGKSSLWIRVKQWLVDDPAKDLQGYLEFSPEVWREDTGTWVMPFVAALGGELPLQKGLRSALRCSFRGNVPRGGRGRRKLQGGSLTDEIAERKLLDRLWDIVFAFDDKVEEVLTGEGSDVEKRQQVAALVKEFADLINGLELPMRLAGMKLQVGGLAEEVAAKEVLNELWDVTYAFHEKIREVVEDDEIPDKKARVASLVREFAELVNGLEISVKAGLQDAAPMTAPWDYTDADYTVEQLARASAWIDGVDGDPHTVALPDDLTKDQCHLRHHNPNGTANWKGIVSAYGVLMGARGGWNASENAKAEALTHLRRDAKRYFDRELGESAEGSKQGLVAKFVSEMKAEFKRLIKAREEVNKQVADNLLELLSNMSGMSADEVKAELATLASTPPDTEPDKTKGQGDGEGEGDGGGGNDQLAQIAQQLDDLGQRVAALEARVDQLTEGGDGEGEGAEAKKAKKKAAGGNGDERESRDEVLKAALGAELKAQGIDVGDGKLSEAELVAAVEDYAAKNKITFSEAYAKLRQKAGLPARA
jgi:hypothetical protein